MYQTLGNWSIIIVIGKVSALKFINAQSIPIMFYTCKMVDTDPPSNNSIIQDNYDPIQDERWHEPPHEQDCHQEMVFDKNSLYHS